jgi:hypothetical protein
MLRSRVRSRIVPIEVLVVVVVAATISCIKFVKSLAYQAYDQPIAISYDNGETISFFKIPFKNDKTRYTLVSPGQEEFKKILKSGDFGCINVTQPPVTIKKEGNRPGPTRKCRAFSIVFI